MPDCQPVGGWASELDIDFLFAVIATCPPEAELHTTSLTGYFKGRHCRPSSPYWDQVYFTSPWHQQFTVLDAPFPAFGRPVAPRQHRLHWVSLIESPHGAFGAGAKLRHLVFQRHQRWLRDPRAQQWQVPPIHLPLRPLCRRAPAYFRLRSRHRRSTNPRARDESVLSSLDEYTPALLHMQSHKAHTCLR